MYQLSEPIKPLLPLGRLSPIPAGSSLTSRLLFPNHLARLPHQEPSCTQPSGLRVPLVLTNQMTASLEPPLSLKVHGLSVVVSLCKFFKLLY